MGYCVQKYIFMVVTVCKNGKRRSGVWTFNIGKDNVYAELENIDDIESAIAFNYKKLAMDVAKDYNESFMAEDTYLYKRGA